MNDTIPPKMADARAPAVRNPFGENASPRVGTVTGDVATQREMAEVQAAVMMAKRFPRDPIAAMDRILQACTRQSLAEGALYSYARGGTEITGPSIRLAEAISQQWGNMQCGIRELEQHGGESAVEAYAWDLETNTRINKVFHVPHLRHTKNGPYALTDPRDIYEAVANQGARRLRACILAVVPGDVVEGAMKQCEETLRTSLDNSPAALKKMLSAFAEFGVTQKQIETRCQCRLEAIRPAQLVQLRKIYTSLKDGMSVASDWFAAPKMAEVGADTMAASAETPKRRGRPPNAERQQREAATPTTQESPPDEETGEIKGEPDALDEKRDDAPPDDSVDFGGSWS